MKLSATLESAILIMNILFSSDLIRWIRSFALIFPVVSYHPQALNNMLNNATVAYSQMTSASLAVASSSSVSHLYALRVCAYLSFSATVAQKESTLPPRDVLSLYNT